MAIDPVCGMDVDETTSTFFSEYKGRKFFFCGKMCKEEFDDDPERFLRLESKLKR